MTNKCPQSDHVNRLDGDLITWFQQRKTIRHFSDRPISEETMRDVLEASITTPKIFDINISSLLWIQDSSKRKAIHDCCRSEQPQLERASHFLLVCIDFSAIDRFCSEIQSPFEPEPMSMLILGSIDASIVAQSIIMVAESLGWGICPIGSILANQKEVCNIANLPPFVLPIFGLCVGVPHARKRSADRSRLPLQSILHIDNYTEPSSETLQRCYEKLETNSEDDDWRLDEKLVDYWGPGGAMHRFEKQVKECLTHQNFLNENDSNMIFRNLGP